MRLISNKRESFTHGVQIGKRRGVPGEFGQTWPACCQLKSHCALRSTAGFAERSDTQTSVAWDPEGIYKDTVPQKGGYFSSMKPVATVDEELDPVFLKQNPIKPLKGKLSNTMKLKKILLDRYMPVNLDLPNVQLLHLDPPIFLVENFWSKAKCKELIEELRATGRMAQSTVGADNLYSSSVKDSNRRTSSSVLIDDQLQEEFPRIGSFAEEIQQNAFEILQGNRLGQWGRSGKQPLFQQYCFEALQAAEYQQGQHFLEHEDAFPVSVAEENKFQRHATVLLYLNDVEQGGETTFSHLNISVKPRGGSALIFFPSFSDGTPDHRTLHIATDAEDVKWVTQQWISRGFNSRLASQKQLAEEGKVDAVLSRRKATGAKKKAKGSGKGFSI